MLNEYPMTLLNQHVEYCKEKVLFHRHQADSALAWHNFLGVGNVILTGAQALTMTVQTTLQCDNATVTITGGSFAFLLAILNRVSISYNFNVLSVLHNILADDFNELVILFTKMLGSSETFDKDEYEKLINKFIAINEKTHLQTVRDCIFFNFCC